MVGKFRDVEQVGHQLAHHLSGIVPAVIGERELLIVVKELLAHVALHVRAHHVSLIAHVIFAKALDEIHCQKPQCNERKGAEDHGTVPRKKCCPQDLREGEIRKADKCRA